MNKYEPVIGLEVHVELKTKSKMFCGCSADYFGKEPNTHTCPVCLGLPGSLPVPNRKAIEWCVMMGLALQCEIPHFSKFDRKNYYYPDLPKGYQISQYEQPFAINGFIDIVSHMEGGKEELRNENQELNKKRIRIRRVHMEEDSGKLIHAVVNGERVSLIDFNRSGVPLVEIVTEPDFSSAEEVVAYLKKIQQIVRYLNVSNADMEKGDMRLEPNISLRPTGSNDLPSYKVEVKNINSFKFVEKAIAYELKRQTALLERGETPTQETRGFVEKTASTKPHRSKEEAKDYRYFPEPDIPPVKWEPSYIEELRSQMPELPDARTERLMRLYSLSDYDAEILTREETTADYFEEATKIGEKHGVTPKQVANILINKKMDKQKEPATLIKMIKDQTNTETIDEDELKRVIQTVLSEHEKAVLDYKNGKESAIMFLVGQIMRKLQKKVDVQYVSKLLTDALRK